MYIYDFLAGVRNVVTDGHFLLLMGCRCRCKFVFYKSKAGNFRFRLLFSWVTINVIVVLRDITTSGYIYVSGGTVLLLN